MTQKIMIESNALITCPRCNHNFELLDGISKQTIDNYTDELESFLKSKTFELEELANKKALKLAEEKSSLTLNNLKDQLAQSKEAEIKARESLELAKEEAVQKALESSSLESQKLKNDLLLKEESIQKFREQELALRKEKQILEENQKNLDLEIQRKVDEERKKISDQEFNRYSLKEAEWKKKIEDAQKSNEDLRKKLEQGSNQLQGEVLELEIENSLTTNFYQDLIEEVKKGVRGADVIQTVRTQTGVVAGKIIWEAKRAENWSDKWLEKLKEDQHEAKADLAVIVTTAMPKNSTEAFQRIGDVWVISPQLIRPMAETLRVILLEAHKLRQINIGRDDKVERLYNYISSTIFSQKIRSVFDTFVNMQNELNAEKRALTKIWSKRQTQIDRITQNMTTIVGELQGLANNALPNLNDIESLEQLSVENLQNHDDFEI